MMQSDVLSRLALRDLQIPKQGDRPIHTSISMISLSGPSGSGKNFIADQLQAWYRSCTTQNEAEMPLVRSFTTKELCKGQDHEYVQVSREEFMDLVENGEFLWNTNPDESHGNLYGTLRCDIDEALSHPWPSLIHVTPHTVHHLREYEPARARVFSIYLKVDNDTLLHQRLIRRNRGDDIERRLDDCKKWKEFAGKSGRFNLCVDNDSTKRSLSEILKEIITALQNPIGLPIWF